MRRGICGFLGFVSLVVVVAGTAQAEVNVNINIGPPPIVVSAPAQVVMMPQTGIYFVPGISYDLFFYNGYWWSQRGDNWYRAGEYNGPWVVIQRNYVPGYLLKVPKNYRAVYKNEKPINYGQWKKNYGQPKKKEGGWKNQSRGGEGGQGKKPVSK